MSRPLSRPIPASRLASAVAIAVASFTGSKPAGAEPAAPPGDAAQTSAPGTDPTARAGSSVQGFDVLASAGWGASTTPIGNLELAPYGASFGIDLGYTWAFGFRLGAHFDDSLGHGVVQPRDPRVGRDFEFTADTSSLNGGLSVGWDLRLDALLLRYSLRVGVTAMYWDFEGISARRVTFEDTSSPSVGVNVAPGVALLWPYRWVEAGIGFEYLAQANGAIPSGLVGKLLVGVRP